MNSGFGGPDDWGETLVHMKPVGTTHSPLQRYGVHSLGRLCRFYLDCVEAEDLRSLRLSFDQRGRARAPGALLSVS